MCIQSTQVIAIHNISRDIFRSRYYVTEVHCTFAVPSPTQLDQRDPNNTLTLTSFVFYFLELVILVGTSRLTTCYLLSKWEETKDYSVFGVSAMTMRLNKIIPEYQKFLSSKIEYVKVSLSNNFAKVYECVPLAPYYSRDVRLVKILVVQLFYTGCPKTQR